MDTATCSQGCTGTLLLALLYGGHLSGGFRYGQAVFMFVIAEPVKIHPGDRIGDAAEQNETGNDDDAAAETRDRNDSDAAQR